MLDALVRCRTIAFDKTGTLTTGALACSSMRPVHQTTSKPLPSHNSLGMAWYLVPDSENVQVKTTQYQLIRLHFQDIVSQQCTHLQDHCCNSCHQCSLPHVTCWASETEQ